MELNNSTVVKTPEAEAEAPTPTRIQLPVSKTSPFSNGVLKRHAPPQPHLHPPLVVAYRECLKNHAAALGGLAVDGCGEFMPSPSSNPADPTSLRCAACGCHRNFHRREPEETPHPPFLLPAPPQPAALEYRPHHRHHPPPPPGSPDESPSPPPISSAYYPSAPHMLLALGHPDGGAATIQAVLNPNAGGRKRFRTKFTHGQKEKMQELAERVGWKMQRRDEDLINGFCGEIGVDKGVFKVWMHNNKNTLGKREHFSTPPAANGAAVEDHYHHRRPEENNDGGKENVHDHNGSARIIGTNNGSSSTS